MKKYLPILYYQDPENENFPVTGKPQFASTIMQAAQLYGASIMLDGTLRTPFAIDFAEVIQEIE